MKDTLTSLFIGLLYVLGFADYGVGVVHSFNKHGMGDGFIGMIAFPWAMYRGAEFWWHNDYADVDWSKRLESDMRTCIYFITQATDKDANVYKANEEAEEFSSKINKYPKDKRQFLIDGSRKYIAYSKSAMEDIITPMNTYYSTGSFKYSESPTTKKMATELINTYKLKDEIDYLGKAMSEQEKQINSQPTSEHSDSEVEEMKNKFESSVALMKTKTDNDYKRIFKNIFNEEL